MLRRYLLPLTIALLAIPLIRTTFSAGTDLRVYHAAAQAALQGLDIYDVHRSGFMVFKYPPWIFPFFFAVGWASLTWTKVFWSALLMGSIISICAWLRRKNVRPQVIALTFVLFQGIWMVHVWLGQISLPLLAAALWLKRRPAWLALILSTKIFTLLPLIEILQKRRQSKFPSPARLITGAFVLAVILSLPLVINEGVHGRSPGAIFQSWVAASLSGGAIGSANRDNPPQSDIPSVGTLHDLEVLNRENQGIAAAVLRAMGESSSTASTKKLALMSLAIGLPLVLIWISWSARLPEPERWAGWLALTAVVQPLGWFHVFAFAFPAAAMALDRAWQNRARPSPLILAALGILAIAVITAKTVGDVGLWLETWSIKSIGVFLVLLSLLKASDYRYEVPGG